MIDKKLANAALGRIFKNPDMQYGLSVFEGINFDEVLEFSKKMDLLLDLSGKNWRLFCELFLREVKYSEIKFMINIPIKIRINRREDDNDRYEIYINNKRIGSIALKYK